MEDKPDDDAIRAHLAEMEAVLVPEDDEIRRLREVLDFSFVDELSSEFADDDCDLAQYDTEVICRLIFLQIQDKFTDREIVYFAMTGMAYRVFLGIDWGGELPPAAALSRFRDHLGPERFKTIFMRLVKTGQEHGLVRKRLVLLDPSTSANDIEARIRAALARLIPDAFDMLEETHDVSALRVEYEALMMDRSDLLIRQTRKRLLRQWLILANVVASTLADIEDRTEAEQYCLEVLLDLIDAAPVEPPPWAIYPAAP
jgi:transposase